MLFFDDKSTWWKKSFTANNVLKDFPSMWGLCLECKGGGFGTKWSKALSKLTFSGIFCFLVYFYLNKNGCSISSDNVSDQKTYVKLDKNRNCAFLKEKAIVAQSKQKKPFTDYDRKSR